MLGPQIAAWVGSALLVSAMVSTLVAFNDGYAADLGKYDADI
jgi:hypothetical protein